MAKSFITINFKCGRALFRRIFIDTLRLITFCTTLLPVLTSSILKKWCFLISGIFLEFLTIVGSFIDEFLASISATLTRITSVDIVEATSTKSSAEFTKRFHQFHQRQIYHALVRRNSIESSCCDDFQDLSFHA